MDAAVKPSVPAGMLDPRWLAVSHRLIAVTEGAFVDSPADHGGATKYGLSLRFLAQEEKINPQLMAALEIGHDGQVAVPDIKALTIAQALGVYFPEFWMPCAARLPAPIDAAVFDQTVNDGLTPAVKMLQLALNGLPQPHAGILVDGVFGPGTLAAVQKAVTYAGVSAVLAAYRGQAVARYQAIVQADPSQQPNLAGWLNRARELGDV